MPKGQCQGENNYGGRRVSRRACRQCLTSLPEDCHNRRSKLFASLSFPSFLHMLYFKWAKSQKITPCRPITYSLTEISTVSPSPLRGISPPWYGEATWMRPPAAKNPRERPCLGRLSCPSCTGMPFCPSLGVVSVFFFFFFFSLSFKPLGWCGQL